MGRRKNWNLKKWTPSEVSRARSGSEERCISSSDSGEGFVKGATLVLHLWVNNFERKRLLRVHRFLTVGAHIYSGSQNDTFREKDCRSEGLRRRRGIRNNMLRTIATSSLVSLGFEQRYLARYVNSRGEEGMRCEIGECKWKKKGLRRSLFKTVFKIQKN